MNLYLISGIALGMSILSFLNSEKLRKRLNNLEDILKEKKLINDQDIVNKIVGK